MGIRKLVAITLQLSDAERDQVAAKFHRLPFDLS